MSSEYVYLLQLLRKLTLDLDFNHVVHYCNFSKNYYESDYERVVLWNGEIGCDTFYHSHPQVSVLPNARSPRNGDKFGQERL